MTLFFLRAHFQVEHLGWCENQQDISEPITEETLRRYVKKAQDRAKALIERAELYARTPYGDKKNQEWFLSAIK